MKERIKVNSIFKEPILAGANGGILFLIRLTVTIIATNVDALC